jgi:hypothetical protein
MRWEGWAKFECSYARENALYKSRLMGDHMDIRGIDTGVVRVQNYEDLCGSYPHYDEATVNIDSNEPRNRQTRHQDMQKLWTVKEPAMTKNNIWLHEILSARALPVARLRLCDGLFQTASDRLTGFNLVLEQGILAGPGVVQL